MWVLVARVLLVGLSASLLVACADPGLVAAHAALQSLVGLLRRHAVDDVLRLEPDDVVCNGRDDVATKFLGLAEVLAVQAELVLLGHVITAHSADLVHDVEKDSLGCAVAGSCVLVLVTNVAASDIHSTISGEGDAVRQLLAPA